MKGTGQTFSKEPNNLKGKNAYRYNGLIHKKSVGVVPASDGKGIVLVTTKSKNQRKPAKFTNRMELKKGARRSLETIDKVIRKGKYRRDLRKVAMRRASALLSSQKPVVLKKTRGKKTQ